jgi:hypothetical protein
MQYSTQAIKGQYATADGYWTLQTQETSDPGNFGTSTKVSRTLWHWVQVSEHFGPSAEVSDRHFGTGSKMSRTLQTQMLKHTQVKEHNRT